MDPALLRLMEELLESMEQRDRGDPDAPAWEATIRIRRLEEELVRRLGSVTPGPTLPGPTLGVAVHDGELVGTA